MILIYIRVFVLVMILTACASPNDTSKHQEDVVVHVVLIWLKDAANESHIQDVIDTTRQLEGIPEIQELRVGISIQSNRNIVDDSFDVGIYMTFANHADMESYLQHGMHKRAVQTVLKPLADKILVYDFSTTHH